MATIIRRRFRFAMVVATTATLISSLFSATSPALAVDDADLRVTVTSSAAFADAGTDVVFTVRATNVGTREMTFPETGDDYGGAGVSVGLWVPELASCLRAIDVGGAGGFVNDCFERIRPEGSCLEGSAAFPEPWRWVGLFSSDRPASLEPGESFSCTVGVRMLRGLPVGTGLALEAWASPEFERWPGQSDGDTSSVAVTVPATGTPNGPGITGTPAVGKTLTAVSGFTGPWDESVTYQWLRDGVPIRNATNDTYRLPAADAGSRISIRVTGQNTKLWPTTQTMIFTSPSTARVALGAFAGPRPTIAGVARVGMTLTAKAGTWKPAASLTYQWYRGSVKISGATKASYSLTAGDRGKTLTVKVTGKKSGYQTTTLTSAKTATVAIGRFSTVPKPTIAGVARVGRKLTATAGTWKPTASLAYQWYRGGAKISGARKATYVLTAGDRGKTLTVKVTGRKTGYQTTTVTAPRTAKVRG